MDTNSNMFYSRCKRVILLSVLTDIPVRRTCCETRNIGHRKTLLSPTHVVSPLPTKKVREIEKNEIVLYSDNKCLPNLLPRPYIRAIYSVLIQHE